MHRFSRLVLASRAPPLFCGLPAELTKRMAVHHPPIAV